LPAERAAEEYGQAEEGSLPTSTAMRSTVLLDRLIGSFCSPLTLRLATLHLDAIRIHASQLTASGVAFRPQGWTRDVQGMANQRRRQLAQNHRIRVVLSGTSSAVAAASSGSVGTRTFAFLRRSCSLGQSADPHKPLDRHNVNNPVARAACVARVPNRRNDTLNEIV
jgi:hypothetical protein